MIVVMLICPSGLQIHATPGHPICPLRPWGSSGFRRRHILGEKGSVLLGGLVPGRVNQGDFRKNTGSTIWLLMGSMGKRQALSKSGRPWEDVIAED